MIYGIGTDIVKVDRITSAYQKFGDRFLCRIYCEHELQLFNERNRPMKFLATRFAAKEAFAKALGIGIRNGVSMREICITNDDLGKPLIKCHGKTDDVVSECGVTEIFLSISDEREFAISYVLLMGRR